MCTLQVQLEAAWGTDGRRDALEAFQGGSECDCFRHRRRTANKTITVGMEMRKHACEKEHLTVVGGEEDGNGRLRKRCECGPVTKAPAADKDTD